MRRYDGNWDYSEFILSFDMTPKILEVFYFSTSYQHTYNFKALDNFYKLLISYYLSKMILHYIEGRLPI